MWIKTQGGYLLNLNRVDFINYDNTTDYTYAHSGNMSHILCEGDVTTIMANAIMRGTKFMEA
jgi:hypothetical protein